MNVNDMNERLFQRRIELKLSQADVARRMGTAQSHISELENGAGCNVATLDKWCQALDGYMLLEFCASSDPPVTYEDKIFALEEARDTALERIKIMEDSIFNLQMELATLRVKMNRMNEAKDIKD